MPHRDRLDRLAHRWELSVDMEDLPDDQVRIRVMAGEPDMIGGFLDDLTDDYFADVEAVDDTLQVTVRKEKGTLDRLSGKPRPDDS